VNFQTIQGVTPLHNAVRSCRESVVQLLVEAKADVNLKTRDNLSPIDEAVEFNYKSLVELMGGVPRTAANNAFVAELANVLRSKPLGGKPNAGSRREKSSDRPSHGSEPVTIPTTQSPEKPIPLLLPTATSPPGKIGFPLPKVTPASTTRSAAYPVRALSPPDSRPNAILRPHAPPKRMSRSRPSSPERAKPDFDNLLPLDVTPIEPKRVPNPNEPQGPIQLVSPAIPPRSTSPEVSATPLVLHVPDVEETKDNENSNSEQNPTALEPLIPRRPTRGTMLGNIGRASPNLARNDPTISLIRTVEAAPTPKTLLSRETNSNGLQRELSSSAPEEFTANPVRRAVTNAPAPAPNYFEQLNLPQAIPNDPFDMNSLDKALVPRWQVIQELVQTEFVYTKQLGVIIALYLRPLEAQVPPILNEIERYDVFLNVEKLFQLSYEILQGFFLEKQKPFEEQSYGAVFVKHAEKFEEYNKYCVLQTSSMGILASLRKENRAFEQFLNAAKDREESMKQDLNGYLIKPFQRVCKYVLLLKELIKNTPPEWPDYTNCQTAMSTIDAVVRKANEIQRLVDNLSKLQEVQSMIDMDLEESRMLKFVCEGDFKELDLKGQKHQRHFYLFSGLLLVTKPARGNKLVTKYAIPIENVLIWDVHDSDLASKGAANGFQLMSYSKAERIKITFICPSAGQKENWMNCINETVSSYGLLFKGKEKTVHVLSEL